MIDEKLFDYDLSGTAAAVEFQSEDFLNVIKEVARTAQKKENDFKVVHSWPLLLKKPDFRYVNGY